MIIIAIIIGAIITVKLNSKTIFNKSVEQIQKVMIEGLDKNKPICLKSSHLDTLFLNDNNDKILLFMPSNYSIEDSQNTLNLIAEFATELNREKIGSSLKIVEG